MSGFGLGNNLIIRQKISRLSGNEREVANLEFHAIGKAENVFAGTIASINHRGEGGVWVWSNQGLKFFQADKYTVFSYFDVCAGLPDSPELEEKFRIDSDVREITTDINKWAGWVNTGDFVQLIIATPSHGGETGNLREIYAYNLPLFLSLEIGNLCVN